MSEKFPLDTLTTESASVRVASPTPHVEPLGHIASDERDVSPESVLPSHHTHKPSSIDKKERAGSTDLRETDAGRSEGHRPAWMSWISWRYLRAPVLIGTACLILGWWIAGLFTMRHRWIVQTIWAWFFIGLIFFRFVPSSKFGRPIGKIWTMLISEPFFKLPHLVRMTAGWVCLLALIFGSAFGFPRPEGTRLADRAISVFGLFVFQLCFWLTSKNHRAIAWPTVMVGLGLQQVIALFVLKTTAGYDIFKWVATLAADFLAQANVAAAFFVGDDVAAMHLFIISTLAAIIFFIAFVQLLYYLGVMQWMIKKFAWLFYRLLNISGGESIVVTATPFIGQGEAACLVRPYVKHMTASELHLMMTSGFATIAGSVMTAYIYMGVDPSTLVTAAIMSIPASITISKLRYPEVEESLTKGKVVIDRGADNEYREANVLQAFSNGATFGIRVAGMILTNVLTVLSLLYVIDGLLAWIGKSFSIGVTTPEDLKLELIFRYIFYPLAWLMGTPKQDLLHVSSLLGQKFIANEFVAYKALMALRDANVMTERGFTIASYSLAGFANIASVGIQIGVLSSLASNKSRVISSIALSALFCGFISTCQTAGIAGMLV